MQSECFYSHKYNYNQKLALLCGGYVMSTLNSMEIPKPQNWQDFECLVESYLRIRWPDSMTTPFGRTGQSQNGVDIYLRDENAFFTGVQCKKVERLTYTEIEKEIDKAKNFVPPLNHYIIATSMNKSARLQERINVLNSQHHDQGIFSINILFWEDIIALIITDEKVFAQHYPQLLPYNEKIDNYTSICATNVKNSVIGNSIIINTSKNSNIKRMPIQNTIGSNTYTKNYVKHLIERYHEFKRASENANKGQMNYALIYIAIKKEIGFQWDETPNERFEDLCTYIQRRIDNTILGRTRKARGMKNYSTYDEFRTSTLKIVLK